MYQASASRLFGTSSSSTGTNDPRQPHRLRTVSIGCLLGLGKVYGDSVVSGFVDCQAHVTETSQSFGALLRAYLVYTMLLRLWHMCVRRADSSTTAQFVGGDTAKATIPLLSQLRAANKGALFAYSVEVDETEASRGAKLAKTPVHKQIVEEMIHCIDVAADFEDNAVGAKGSQVGCKTWVAVKMTALLPDAQSLTNLSSYIINHRPSPKVPIPFPGCPEPSDLALLDTVPEKDNSSGPLSPEDIASLRELYADLTRICARAKDRGVRIIIDAEYSWYQPAIDAFTLALTRRYNKLPDVNRNTIDLAPVQPLVYGTFQAYLRRTSLQLEQALLDAKRNGYALGVKLVRGTYHPHEVAAWHSSSSGARSLSISPDNHPPVWERKDETDACFNTCVKMLMDAVAQDVGKNHVEVKAEPASQAIVAPVSQLVDQQLSSWISGVASWRPVWPASWSWPGAETSRTLVQLGVSPTPLHDSRNSTSRPVPTIGVLFGTHNWTSCRLIFDELVSRGLAVREGASAIDESGDYVVRLDDDVTERVTIGQLYGMSNALTDHLVARARSRSPLIIKYVPYGALSEVMPYLSRRAVENKSVLGDGGATDERRRAGREIWKRLFG